MNQSNVLDAESLLASCTEIKKVTNLPSAILSGILLLGAGLLLFFSSSLQDHSSSLYMAILTGSVLLIILSVYRLVSQRQQIIYAPTQSVVRKGSAYLDALELHSVQQAIKEQKWEQLKQTSLRHNGNVRIDYLVSDDSQFAAVQLFQYIPYKFEAVSEVQIFQGEEAQQIASFLIQK